MQVAVEIKNLNLKYDHRKTDGIQNLNFNITAGKILSLIGPSGSGKTTTLKCLASLLEPQSGEINFTDKVNIAYVDQFPNLDEEKTVYENLEQVLLTNIKDEEKRSNQIRTTLAMLEITNEIQSQISRLSGGQKQRVIIAMALVNNPTLLLLDEPFANLDKVLRTQLLEDLFALFKEKNITVVWVTHNTEEALSYSDEVALLNFGVLQQIGHPHELYYKPQNLFTAQFFNNMNLIPGKLINFSNDEITVIFLNREFILTKPTNFIKNNNEDILVMAHPEHIVFDPSSNFTGEITNILFKGSRSLVEFSYQELSLVAEISSLEKPESDKFPFSFLTDHLYCRNEI